MATPQDFISQVTYFDLQTLTYTEFVQEIVFTHALLQRRASGNCDDHELILFNDMQWWYSITLTPASFSYTPRQWSSLVNENDYRNMLQHIMNYLGPAELTVEFTNNLSFGHSDSGLPLLSYPRTEHTLKDGSIIMAPIYPCLLRLNETAILSLPSTTYNSSCQANETWDLTKSKSIESTSLQSSDDDDTSLRPSSSSSNKHSSYPLSSRHHTDVSTLQENHISPFSSHDFHSSPRHLFSSTPIKIRPTRRQILPVETVPLTGSTRRGRSSHLFFPPTFEDLEESIAPQYHRSNHHLKDTANSPSSRPPTLLRLYLRPPSHIYRRYSDRFDQSTLGLNSASRSKTSRPSLHSSKSWDARTYLDLAGKDSVTVEDCGEEMDSYLFVDVERVPNQKDGINTSVLWRVGRFVR